MGSLIDKLKFYGALIYIPGNAKSILRARAVYESLIDISLNNGIDQSEIAEAYTWVMNASIEVEDYAAAIVASDRGMSHSPSPLVAATLLSNRASAHGIQNEYGLALRYAQDALDQARNANHPQLLQACKENLSALLSLEPLQFDHVQLGAPQDQESKSRRSRD